MSNKLCPIEGVKTINDFKDMEIGKVLVLADCAPWEAQLSKEVYVYGQVFVVPTKKCDAPGFLGQRDIDGGNKLIKLIDVVSQVLLKGLEGKGCDKIYLASLNESKERKLHFWLLPRYARDSSKVAKVSGFFLISDYVREYLARSDKCRRNKCGKSKDCDHKGPFVPFEHDGTPYEDYGEYAGECRKWFAEGWEKVRKK